MPSVQIILRRLFLVYSHRSADLSHPLMTVATHSRSIFQIAELLPPLPPHRHRRRHHQGTKMTSNHQAAFVAFLVVVGAITFDVAYAGRGQVRNILKRFRYTVCKCTSICFLTGARCRRAPRGTTKELRGRRRGKDGSSQVTPIVLHLYMFATARLVLPLLCCQIRPSKAV